MNIMDYQVAGPLAMQMAGVAVSCGMCMDNKWCWKAHLHEFGSDNNFMRVSMTASYCWMLTTKCNSVVIQHLTVSMLPCSDRTTVECWWPNIVNINFGRQHTTESWGPQWNQYADNCRILTTKTCATQSSLWWRPNFDIYLWYLNN